jgi:hypothetical protein
LEVALVVWEVTAPGEGALQGDEFAVFLLTWPGLLAEPVGVDEPWPVVFGMSQDCT